MALIIFCLVLITPPIVLCFVVDKQRKQEEIQKNRRMNGIRHVKIDYELDVYDFVVDEKIRLENEHEKKIEKITKKYGNDFLLYAMSPDDLDEYLREKSYYRQKIRLLDEGLMNFYKNKWGV